MSTETTPTPSPLALEAAREIHPSFGDKWLATRSQDADMEFCKQTHAHHERERLRIAHLIDAKFAGVVGALDEAKDVLTTASNYESQHAAIEKINQALAGLKGTR